MDLAPLVAAAVPLAGWTSHGLWLTRRLATARRDPLTGLRTRDGFTTIAQYLIQRHGDRVSVLLIDLDDFKATNDTHGHQAGDTILATVAERLHTWSTRTGAAARLGGDEFAIAVLDATPERLADLRESLHRPVPHSGLLLPLSASIGVAHLGELPVPSLTDALAAADRDMYAHKPGGRTSRRR